MRQPLAARRLLGAVLVLCIWMPCVPGGAEQEGKPRFVLGYSLRTLYDVDIKDAVAAFSLWSREVGERVGFTVQSQLYEQPQVLLEEFNRGAADLAVIRTTEYFHLFRDKAEYDGMLTPIRANRKTQRYLLIVRSDFPFSTLRDLRQRKIAVIKWDNLGSVYLNTLLLRNNLPPPEGVFSTIEEVARPSQAILSVFFGKMDACLVNDSSFEAVGELNPQVSKALKVVMSSEELVFGLGVFRRTLEPAKKKVILDQILRLSDTPRGRQVLLLFKTERFEEVRPQELMASGKLFAEYQLLKDKRYQVAPLQDRRHSASGTKRGTGE